VAVGDNHCPAGRRIVGYFPSWQGNVVDIQYQYLTHINYSFVLPKPSGALEPISKANENELMQLVTLAHGQAVKVGIAVGGWNDGDDSAFVALAADAEKRARFVKAMVDFVERYQLDGVDMDWEYPSSADQAEHYVQLMQELRAALDALPRAQFLTAAVVAQGDWNGQYIREAVFNEIDFLNIMAYDEYGAVSHSSMDYARTSLEYWAKRGLPRAKAVLGLPFYARPSWLSYQHYVSVDAANACVDSVAGSYYNGLPTMRAKAQLAEAEACGVMVWELSQDTFDQTSLLKSLWEVREGLAPSYLCPD
jgi:GH18 family chitinase